MSKWRLHFFSKGADAVYQITYKSGRFKRLDHIRGRLAPGQYEKLMITVPQLEAAIELFKKEYQGRIEYQAITEAKKSVFSTLLDKYVIWYQEQNNLRPKIDGVAGRHLKQIITYLKSQSASDDELVAVWDLILNKWNELDDFYKNQTELRQINTNLNIILTQIKNGNTARKSTHTATNVANDFRSKFKD